MAHHQPPKETTQPNNRHPPYIHIHTPLGEPTDAFTPEQLPAWVAQLCEGLVACGAFSRAGKPDHVLLNGAGFGVGLIFGCGVTGWVWFTHAPWLR